MPQVEQESALIVRVPSAEPLVSALRLRHDRAAGVGVPAHLTIAYPFKPVELMDPDDLQTLETLFRQADPTTVEFRATGRFDDHTLFLEPSDGAPFIALIEAVGDQFPDYPIYGGAHPQVHPHLTVGQGLDRSSLTAAEDHLRRGLPITQRVDAVELWLGPALDTGRGPWRHTRTFCLGTG